MSRCLFDVEHETECKRDEVDQHPHLSFVPPNHAGVVSEHMLHIKLSAAGAVKIVVSQMTTESMLVACRKLGRILFMFFLFSFISSAVIYQSQAAPRTLASSSR
jgi:hypothetical protein